MGYVNLLEINLIYNSGTKKSSILLWKLHPKKTPF